MIKRLLPILLIATLSGRLAAQENKTGSRQLIQHFHSFNTFHILNGSSTTSVALNTVNGFQSGNFFGGIGIGFDYYFHITIPLFFEARFDLLKQKRKLQLFGNGGLSFPFSSQNKKFEYLAGSYKTGTLYSGGIDYVVPVKKDAFIMGIAFSNKQVIEMADNYEWNPRLNASENLPVKYRYSLNRIGIRVGWMF